MAEITTARKCDGCGCASLDYMADGWIVINGSFIAYSGRDARGQARSHRFCSGGETVFCSWKCLTKGQFLVSEPGHKSKKPATDALQTTDAPTFFHLRCSLIELSRELDSIRRDVASVKVEVDKGK